VLIIVARPNGDESKAFRHAMGPSKETQEATPERAGAADEGLLGCHRGARQAVVVRVDPRAGLPLPLLLHLLLQAHLVRPAAGQAEAAQARHTQRQNMMTDLRCIQRRNTLASSLPLGEDWLLRVTMPMMLPSIAAMRQWSCC